MVLKTKKTIDMPRDNNLYGLVITFFWLCLVNMVSLTLLVFPLYKYLCGGIDGNILFFVSDNEAEDSVVSTRIFFVTFDVLSIDLFCLLEKSTYGGLSYINNFINSSSYGLLFDFENDFFHICSDSDILAFYCIPSFVQHGESERFYLMELWNNFCGEVVYIVIFLFRFLGDTNLFFINTTNVDFSSIELDTDCVLVNSYIENWIHIILEGKVSKIGFLEFKPLQESIIVLPGETTLCFFRIYNPSNLELTCLSYYLVFPESSTLYITKLQCFCFNNMLIHGLESVELPILFYIEKDLIKEVFFTNKIYLYYILVIKE